MKKSRFFLRLFLTSLLFGPLVAGAEKQMSISPQNAKNHVGKKVVVAMKVVKVKHSTRHKRFFLDSMVNFQDPDNLGITLTDDAAKVLATRFATDDLATYLRGKKIVVKGRVVRRNDRTYLDVTDAEQLRLSKTP